MPNQFSLCCLLIVFGLPMARAQKPDFEVASVKPDNSAAHAIDMRWLPGGRFVATGVTAKLLIGFAYDLQDSFIVGGPSWLDSDRFEIEARAADADAEEDRDLMPLRMQSLLEDRFHLKAHRETTEAPIYELVIANGGPRLQLTGGESDKLGGMPKNTMGVTNKSLRGHAVHMSALTKTLSSLLRRTVIDNTGLTDVYDIVLDWNPQSVLLAPPTALGGENPELTQSTAPSIFTALEEQLGLKLESAKGPVEFFVVDNIDRPSRN